MPTNRNSRMPAIHVSVLAAFFDTGSRNAWTPLAIASTPVIAVQPEAKARMRQEDGQRPDALDRPRATKEPRWLRGPA